jgi:hypothetical protein
VAGSGDAVGPAVQAVSSRTASSNTIKQIRLFIRSPDHESIILATMLILAKTRSVLVVLFQTKRLMHSS